MNKIDPDLTLFVGGPMDGRGRRCHPLLDVLDIPLINRSDLAEDPSGDSYFPIEKVRYKRVLFTNKMSVFAHESLSNDDVIRYLILGYRQP